MFNKILFNATVVSAAVGSAATAPPNILICIADDASRHSFGAYGDTAVKTPACDSLARQGAVFQNAYNCNPKCAPARACLVTGRYSWQLKEAGNHWPHFPSEFSFYPHLLQQNGFHVGYTGKGWGPGTYDTEYNPAGPEYSKINQKPPFKKMSWVNYAANFAAFLDEKPQEKPFCFWLGTFEPHRRYDKDAWKKAGMHPEQATVPPFLPDNTTVRQDLLNYGKEVEWFDHHVGRAIEELKDRGLFSNTLIIVTSDHGMPFPRIKGQIYEEGVHVPLIAVWDGIIQPGRTVSDFVNFPDVAPTLMEAAGFKPHPQMTGRSFLDVLQAPESGRIDASRTFALLGKERHDVGRSNEEGDDLGYPVRAIRTDSFLYVRNFKPDRWPCGNPEYDFQNCDDSPTKNYLTSLTPEDSDYTFYEMSFGKRPEEELYRIKDDPHCLKNLAANPEYKTVKEKLYKKLEAELTAQRDPRILGNGRIFDLYPYTGPLLDYETGKLIPTEP